MFNFHLVEKKDNSKLYILVFVMFSSMLLELIGISLIPAYILAITSFEKASEYLPNNFEYLLDYSKQTIIVFLSFLLVGFIFLKNLVQIFTYKMEENILAKLIYKNFVKLFYYYIKKPLLFHNSKNPAELIKNITIANRQAGELIKIWITMSKEVVLIISVSLILLFVDYKVTLSIIIILLSFGSIFFLKYKKMLKKIGEDVQLHNEEIIKILGHSFNGIREVKIFKNENYMKDVLRNQAKPLLQKIYKNEFYSKLPRIFFELIAILMIVSFLTILITSGNTMIDILPLLSLYVVILLRLIPSFSVINTSLNLVSYYSEPFKIINKIFYSIKNEKFDENKLLSFKESDKLEILIKNLSFSYPSSSKKVLNSINIKMKKGEFIGVIGKSGEGKSTLVDLIMGLIKPSEGEILVNKENIYSNLEGWIEKIGYIPQKIYLFDDSIKKNITLGQEDHEINFDKLDEVIKSTHLDKMIADLPMGIETNLGNMGSKISGGQAQRIGIARALYKNPDIIILDEATTSLDKSTEKDILDQFINKKFYDKIIIIISHDLRVTSYCDRLLILENSIIKEISDNEKIIY